MMTTTSVATSQSELPAVTSADLNDAFEMAEVLVSVVMPCLNEARTVGACIVQARAALDSRLYRGEIVIANNGSTDGSQAIAEAAGARVVNIPERGYDSALRGGIAAARGVVVVMGDSDCSYDFGEIPRFVDKLREGYDLVMGNRFAGEIKPGAMPWHHRYIGNPLLSGIGRLLYRGPCRDWHCGLCAFDFRKASELRMRCSGMEFASGRGKGKRIRCQGFFFAFRELQWGNGSLWGAALCFSWLCLAGCGEAPSSAHAINSMSVGGIVDEPRNPNIEWDCGVVLPGEVTRVCFPLELPGVTSSADLVAIDSSCECTQVSIRDAATDSGLASIIAQILIDRFHEQPSDAYQKLSVVLTIRTSKGVRHEARLNVTLL